MVECRLFVLEPESTARMLNSAIYHYKPLFPYLVMLKTLGLVECYFAIENKTTVSPNPVL